MSQPPPGGRSGDSHQVSPVLVEAVHHRPSVSIGHPDVTVATLDDFINGNTTWVVGTQRPCFCLGDSRKNRKLGDNLALKRHLDHPWWPVLAPQAFSQKWGEPLVTIIGSTCKSESRICDPEELLAILDNERDPMSFGEPGIHDPYNVALRVESNQLSSVEAEDLA